MNKKLVFDPSWWRCILLKGKNSYIFKVKHHGKSLFEYYEVLIKISWELDHRDKVIMKNPNEIAVYQKSIKQLKVYIFLIGLDGDFEQVCWEIYKKTFWFVER
jgi:hypothetical protein